MNITAYVNTAPPAETFWLSEYQTLIAALVALLAALIAAYIAYRQLKATAAQVRVAQRALVKDQAARRRDREGQLRAHRASFAVVLSSINEWALALASTLNERLVAAENNVDGPLASRSVKMARDLQPFPTELIGALERVIVLTDDESVIRRIEELLNHIQTFWARARPEASLPWITEFQLAQAIAQLAEIYVLAESLFDFARTGSSIASEALVQQRTLGALPMLGINSEMVRGILRRKARRASVAQTGQVAPEV